MKVNDVSGKDNLCAFQAVSAAVNKYYGRDLSVKCTLGQDLYTIVDPASYPKMLEMREVLVETARRLEEWAHSPAPADESEYDQGLRPLIQQAFPRGRHLQIRAGGQVDHHELDAVNTIVSRLQGLVPPNMQTLRATADYRRSYANPSSAPTNPAATYEPWQAAIPNPDERAYITLLYVRSNHFQQVERRLKNGDLTPWLGDASPSDISLKVMAAAEAAVEEYLASGAAAFPELWPAVSAVGRERAARERERAAREREQRHSMRELVAGAAGAGSGGRQQKMIKQLQEAAGGGWAAQKDADKKREQEQQKQRAAAAAVEAWRRRQEEQARRAAEAKAKAAAAGVPQQHQMIQLRAQQHEQYTKQKRGRRLAFGGAGDEEEGDDKDDARAAPLLGSFLPAPARPYAGSPLPESSNVFDGLIDVDEEMVRSRGFGFFFGGALPETGRARSVIWASAGGLRSAPPPPPPAQTHIATRSTTSTTSNQNNTGAARRRQRRRFGRRRPRRGFGWRRSFGRRRFLGRWWCFGRRQHEPRPQQRRRRRRRQPRPQLPRRQGEPFLSLSLFLLQKTRRLLFSPQATAGRRPPHPLFHPGCFPAHLCPLTLHQHPNNQTTKTIKQTPTEEQGEEDGQDGAPPPPARAQARPRQQQRRGRRRGQRQQQQRRQRQAARGTVLRGRGWCLRWPTKEAAAALSFSFSPFFSPPSKQTSLQNKQTSTGRGRRSPHAGRRQLSPPIRRGPHALPRCGAGGPGRARPAPPQVRHSQIRL
jgi:hypothetical protein